MAPPYFLFLSSYGIDVPKERLKVEIKEIILSKILYTSVPRRFMFNPTNFMLKVRV